MKLCVITCYNQPDYVRAKTLRAAASGIDGVGVIIIKNQRTGVLRYIEVFAKTIRSRLRDKPDVYLLTFRGYEMLLPVRLLTLGKLLVYDEFINPIEWVVKEQRQVEAKQTSSEVYRALVGVASRLIVATVASRPFKWFYGLLVRSVDVVLTDTASHADVSAELTGINRDRYANIPVGVDEGTFMYEKAEVPKSDTFTLFYYGNMLPLHGLMYVIDAAKKMKDQSVRFVLIGGNEKVSRDVAEAVKMGANIEHEPWVEFEELPALMRAADLCLAGPFGGTFQSEYVITGKAFQYLAMGRPTVVGKNRESGVFTHQKNALIVAQGSADALVGAITWSMNHRDDLPAIGLAGRKLYEAKYATTHLSHRLEQILAGLNGRGNAATHADK